MDADITVDAKYKSCPGPLLVLAEAVGKAKAGQVVKLVATDPAAPSDIREWTESTGHTLLASEKTGNEYVIFVKVAP